MKLRFPTLFFLFLLLAGCKVNHLAEIQPQAYRMSDTTVVAADLEIERMIAPYKSRLDAEMEQVIGRAPVTMPKAKPESLLGNWLSDLLYEQLYAYTNGEVDFASVNYGGIRIPTLQAGPVTRGKIFEIMPFDNLVVVVHADAATLRQFIDRVAESGGIPVSKHLRFEIKNGKAQNITIQGQPIQEDRIYKIGVSDYVANGGDDCTFFVDKKRTEPGKLLRDAIIEHVQQQTAAGKEIRAALDGRIKVVQ
ncbi:MAG TPA: 5'-nucleotidase C-terminal domain-containing protein [Saprospiraceae bacterium]|nr:5'-nucleotidase C-terminal domain-containing protein [Saprospiraceae bacterium]HMP25083.1 5'-nucleotidase C-terminal domain-containing protein [Saprospiraceae bacterium]